MAQIILTNGASAATPAAGTMSVYSKTDKTIAYKDDTGLETVLGSALLRSYLAGCTLSTAGSSTTMSIAAGQCADSTNSVMINLAAIAKTTSAWAVGTAQGGLDTGTIATSTWYHFYVIRRPDTGVVDVIFSTNATSPALPTNYTQYRRIGSGKTNGSSQWTSFTQDGDYFRLAASVLDINTTNPGTAAVTATLGSVPSGVNVKALINIGIHQGTSGAGAVYVSDLSANDEAPIAASATLAAPLGSISWWANTTTVNFMSQIEVRTNTSAQIRYRLSVSGAADVFSIATLGWTDTRGRNA